MSYNSTLNSRLLFIWQSLLFLDHRSVTVLIIQICLDAAVIHSAIRLFLEIHFNIALLCTSCTIQVVFSSFSSFDHIVFRYPHTWYILLSFFKSCCTATVVVVETHWVLHNLCVCVCVFVALGIEHTMSMRYIVISGLPRFTIFFHINS
jgi:hypothetical protein